MLQEVQRRVFLALLHVHPIVKDILMLKASKFFLNVNVVIAERAVAVSQHYTAFAVVA